MKVLNGSPSDLSRLLQEDADVAQRRKDLQAMLQSLSLIGDELHVMMPSPLDIDNDKENDENNPNLQNTNSLNNSSDNKTSKDMNSSEDTMDNQQKSHSKKKKSKKWWKF